MYSFAIREQDGSGHIATLSDIEFDNTEHLAQKLYRALVEHYDADIRIWSIPTSIFEHATSIGLTVADDFDTIILVERTFIY